MRPEDVRCEDCVYWWEYEDGKGECRRGPPNRHPLEESDSEVFGQWIDTERGQWCGEFRREWVDERR